MNAANDCEKSRRLSELSAQLHLAARALETLAGGPAPDQELDQAEEKAWGAAWQNYLRERAER